MTKQNTLTNGIILQPSEELSNDFKEKILQMNAGKPNFKVYTERVRNLFQLDKVKITKDNKIFMAGFIEGEGSMSVSAKKNRSAKFGVELDPLFNITQHINGVKHLYFALELFGTGRIRYKAGSKATLVFIIEPRLSLQTKVRPYYENFVYPYSSPAKQIRFNYFKQMLDAFDEAAHLDRQKFTHALLPIWNAMRVQNYAGQTFVSLEEAQEYVRNFT